MIPTKKPIDLRYSSGNDVVDGIIERLIKRYEGRFYPELSVGFNRARIIVTGWDIMLGMPSSDWVDWWNKLLQVEASILEEFAKANYRNIGVIELDAYQYETGDMSPVADRKVKRTAKTYTHADSSEYGWWLDEVADAYPQPATEEPLTNKLAELEELVRMITQKGQEYFTDGKTQAKAKDEYDKRIEQLRKDKPLLFN